MWCINKEYKILKESLQEKNLDIIKFYVVYFRQLYPKIYSKKPKVYRTVYVFKDLRFVCHDFNAPEAYLFVEVNRDV